VQAAQNVTSSRTVRKKKASVTAKMVTLFRAFADGGLTSVPDFHDPFSAAMLGPGFRILQRFVERRLRRMTPEKRAVAIQQFDALPIRVAVIDAELMARLAQGCRQVIILGAGFDTRAYRLPLDGVTVFEVDHPATQAEKRRRVAALPPAKTRVVWTAVDFERDSLTERLAEAGHDARLPTVWIWEGVVMYLADPAVRATLQSIHTRSAPTSTLILNYHEPSEQRGLRRLLFASIGEPQLGLRTRYEMQALVAEAGFAISADLGIAEQAARVGARVPNSLLARVQRILIAGC